MTEVQALQIQRNQAREVSYILLRYVNPQDISPEHWEKVAALIASIEGGPNLPANLERTFTD